MVRLDDLLSVTQPQGPLLEVHATWISLLVPLSATFQSYHNGVFLWLSVLCSLQTWICTGFQLTFNKMELKSTSFQIHRIEPRHVKTCLCHVRTTKMQISLRSVISACVVRCLNSIITLVSISQISSLYLVSVTAQIGLSLPWSETPKTGFLVMRLNYIYIQS